MSTEKKSTEVVKKQSDVTALVLNKVNTFQKSGELRIPKDYSPENAIKAAYLVLNEQKNKDGKPILESCTNVSIANALLKMVVWGVSPLKGQIYFIPYADKLEASISYLGNVMMAKRYGNLKTIKANCIMEGDEFEFGIDPETGRRKIIKHIQTLESIGSEKILGAYASFELNDGTKDVEIMNMSQIKKSWEQGATKGASPAHRNYPDQMALRTVLNRACKILIRASDDKVLYDDFDKEIDYQKEDVDYEIENNANGEVIDIYDDVSNETPEPTKSNKSEKTTDETQPKMNF